MSESSGSLYRMGTALAPPDSTNLTYDAAIQERFEEEEEEAESQFLSDSLVFSPHVGCDRIPIKGLLFVPAGCSSDSSSPPPSALTCKSWFAKEFLPPNGYSVLNLIFLGSSRILLVPLAASACSIHTNSNATTTTSTTLWSMKDCIFLAINSSHSMMSNKTFFSSRSKKSGLPSSNAHKCDLWNSKFETSF